MIWFTVKLCAAFRDSAAVSRRVHALGIDPHTRLAPLPA